MGGLARFFCLSGGSSRRADWSAGRSYGETYGSQGLQSKVLEILEEELDQRLGGTNITVQSLSSVPLRRMYKAGLPAQEMQQCKELLGKIAALDQAREAAVEEKTQLSQALKAAEMAHRQAEFSRAKAEALATARGEALMHAQQATREAQREQAQLSEMLKQTLQQLGMAMTPNRSPAGTPEGSLITFEQSPIPQPHFLPLPHQLDSHPAAPPHQQEAPPQQQRQQHQPQSPVHNRRQERQQQAPAEVRLSHDSEASLEMSREFSGFTVYTNQLHDSAELGATAQSSATAVGNAAASNDSMGRAAVVRQEEVRQSRVPWRDISSAVEASLSVECSAPAAAQPPSLCGSVAQLALPLDSRSELLKQDTVAAAMAGATERPSRAGSSSDARQAQIQRLARLVLPTLDASQLDSLVRVGASLPSPDMLMSPQVLSQLLPKLWDSSANPLPSPAAPMDMQQLLEQLSMQQQQQQGQIVAVSAAAGREVAAPAGSSKAGQAGGKQNQSGGPLRSSGSAAEGAGPNAAAGKAKEKGKAPRAGTWLSPLKIGQGRAAGEPSPSPLSHVKAVFRDDHDIQFYLPFSAGLHKPNAAAKEEYKTRAAEAAAAPAPALLALPAPPRPSFRPSSRSSSPKQAQQPPKQAASTAAAAAPTQPGGRHSRRPSAAQDTLSSWDLAAAQQSAEGSLQSRQSQSSAEPRPGTAGSSRAGSLRGSREGATSAAPGQPAGRKQAFLSRFQPMGHAAAQPAAADAAVAALGGRQPSANENLLAAGLHRQQSAELRQQQQQHDKRQEATKKSTESGDASLYNAAQGRQFSQRVSDSRAPGGVALTDTTNAGEGYLLRLAQQRVQQAYGGPISQLR